MRILFIHQGFPSQFVHLAPALARRGHEVTAMPLKNQPSAEWQGVKLEPYLLSTHSSEDLHPLLVNVESKIIRAEGCLRAAEKMKKNGFYPDIIIAHPSWGESLFLKILWPEAHLSLYCEYFDHIDNNLHAFDPEFHKPEDDTDRECQKLIACTNNLLQLHRADSGISPTHWQANTFPAHFQSKITVIHDGIHTMLAKPNCEAKLQFGETVLGHNEEIITFVSREIEPLRGAHRFLRAVPDILRQRPQAHIVIVGGNQQGYGAIPDGKSSWKENFSTDLLQSISPEEAKRVHFAGKVKKSIFLEILQVSSVHVYLSYPFVLSWSFLEAMSTGCAIVACDNAPVKEVAEHDKDAILIDFFDHQSLVQAICSLLNNPEKAAWLGHNAREKVVAKYDLGICLPKQVEWLEKLR